MNASAEKIADRGVGVRSAQTRSKERGESALAAEFSKAASTSGTTGDKSERRPWVCAAIAAAGAAGVDAAVLKEKEGEGSSSSKRATSSSFISPFYAASIEAKIEYTGGTTRCESFSFSADTRVAIVGAK